MKESYRKGVANHPDLDPCEGIAKKRVHLKRWEEAHVGGVSRSSELRNRQIQGADGVSLTGRQQRDVRQRECGAALRSRRPQACMETSRARTERPRCYPRSRKAAER
jgi:hypothetical protein